MPDATRVIKVLSDDEAACLLKNVLNSCPTGATEQELGGVMNWAIRARLNSVLLEKALAGEVQLSLRDGEVTFSLRAR
jgi:hypothetical protein